ncbi:MAG TPA: SUMF1/EgtB/PvdO family nonheme iron enzyme [Candidatus Dormibacteraeota bacterium]|nr:SUMF1/EgtB/PvdO family nonheme iron enzyme [Candidatus Dormibacteraeota bacterium]
MGAPAAVRIRHDLQTRLLQARSRTDEIFSLIKEEALYDRPVAERHRLIFYLGHVEAFDWNLLGRRAFGIRSFHSTFDQLFAFGIDPVGGGLPTDTPQDWPARKEIDRYNHRLREDLDSAIESAMEHPSEGHPQLLEMLETAIEHRLMHAETLAYLLHRLPYENKVGKRAPIHAHSRQLKPDLVEIPEGEATLGMNDRDGEVFGWDNERGECVVSVPTFAIERHNVTNGDFLRFVQAGGYNSRSLWTTEDWAWKEANGIEHPAFWHRNGNIWMAQGMFEELRLPLDWPVYVSHAEATAYANWLGRRLPNEEQYHRAAYGVPDNATERLYPWGKEAPSSKHGNFDFVSWDPAPVGANPAGASAFGVHDLVGNGWEWTRTIFGPLPGFSAMPFYPGYSANFFDGQHYVMKGGSPRTAACMLRRSFRNWFQPHYPYVYATFRCVED